MNTRLAVLSAFGICVFAGALFWLFRPNTVERLQPYLGQDLRALSEDEQIEFDDLIGRLAPEARVFNGPAADLGPGGMAGLPQREAKHVRSPVLVHLARGERAGPGKAGPVPGADSVVSPRRFVRPHLRLRRRGQATDSVRVPDRVPHRH